MQFPPRILSTPQPSSLSPLRSSWFLRAVVGGGKGKRSRERNRRIDRRKDIRGMSERGWVTSLVRYNIALRTPIRPHPPPALASARSLHSRSLFHMQNHRTGAPLWRIVGSGASVQSTTPRLFPAISSASLQDPFFACPLLLRSLSPVS